MARAKRRTDPVQTTEGLVRSYEELEPRLVAAEGRGRLWIMDRLSDLRARSVPLLERVPDTYDVLDLHRAMLAQVFEWAGTTRMRQTNLGARVASRPAPGAWIRVQDVA